MVVTIERIDRASLRAIAYARSISWDVTVLHPDHSEDLSAHLERSPDLVVVVPTIVPRPRWLYPLVNWGALRRARDARRDGAVVVTVPYRV